MKLSIVYEMHHVLTFNQRMFYPVLMCGYKKFIEYIFRFRFITVARIKSKSGVGLITLSCYLKGVPKKSER